MSIELITFIAIIIAGIINNFIANNKQKKFSHMKQGDQKLITYNDLKEDGKSSGNILMGVAVIAVMAMLFNAGKTTGSNEVKAALADTPITEETANKVNNTLSAKKSCDLATTPTRCK